MNTRFQAPIFALLVSVLFAVSCATVPKQELAGRAHPSLEIYQISSMADVEKWIVPDTLILLDLDNTLFEAKKGNMKAHANWFHDLLKKYPTERQKILQHHRAAIKTAEYQPVESITPELIKDWQNRGIAVMALTSRNMVLVEATLRQVKSVGVDFSLTSPRRKEKSRYFQQGILFANNQFPKGEALTAYLKETGFVPKRIILVDDLLPNLESVCKSTGAIGLFYPLVDDKRPTEWDEKEVERSWLEQ
ncbi:MAG: DUF2608 domain-containing protein [Myxococcota bacterium]